MARLCERPGCSIPASVLYGFEAAGAVVWLDAWSPDEPRRNLVGVLCRRHADALTPPRGWWLDDRRIAAPRLFDVLGANAPDDAPSGSAPISDDDSAGPSSPRRPRRKPGHDTEELSFPFVDGAVVDTDEAVLAPPSSATEVPAERTPPPRTDRDHDPDETRAMAWTPRFDRTDDLGGVLAAESRLLSRAFGMRRSPH